MFIRYRRPFLMLGFLVFAGCSLNQPKCIEEVANKPGMTCLDVGMGWYHFQFASQAQEPGKLSAGKANEGPGATETAVVP